MKKELPRYPVIDIVATGQNIRRLRLEKGYTVDDMQTYLGLGCSQRRKAHNQRPQNSVIGKAGARCSCLSWL